LRARRGRPHGRPRHARDRRGQKILELTRAEIVRRLRTGEAVRLDDEPKEPLFDRIMTGLVDKLKTPAKATA